MSENPRRAIERRAREALQSGDWALAERLVEHGDATLHELVEQMRVYQAELEMQAQELAESRLRTERGLRRFVGLFSMLPLAAVLADGHGLVIEANREAELLFGAGVHHLRSHSLMRLVHAPAARMQLQHALARALRDGRAEVAGIEIDLGGQARFADVFVEHVAADDDHGEQFIVLFADRSEQVLAQRALAAADDVRRQQEAQNRRLALVAARTRSLVVITDAAGRITWVNDSFTQRTGYTLDEVAGRSPGAFLQGPGTDPAVVNLMRERLRQGLGFDAVEILNYDKQRRPYWLELDVQPVGGADGHPECFVAVEHDITERRSAEQALRARDEFQRAVFDNDPSAIVVLRRDGRVQTANAAAQRLLGVPTAAALQDRLLVDWLRPQTPAPFATLLATALTGRAAEAELEVAGAGGTLMLELHVAPLWLGGAVNGALVLARDVSALREVEEARRQRRAAELANEAKTQFLSRMSHELRTPLNAVIGFAQLVRDDPVQPLGTVQRDRLLHIESAGLHLLALINEVLQLSQIESGHLSMALRPCDFGEVLGRSLGHVEPQRAARDVTIAVDVPPGLWVQADPVRLTEVFNNLLSNAVKYNVAGGRVDVVARPAGERVQVEVRDTGLGMTADQIGHLYEPFNRLGAERTRIEGSGMGLVVTRSLVALMDGTLTVRSTPGQGTVFGFTLAQAAAGLPQAPVDAAAADAPAPALNLLYVEDNELNVIVLQELLARWRPQWRVEVATSGEEGLAAARRRCPDLVLLDITLPDISGLEVRQRLGALPETAGVPCIALSASVLAEEREAALAAGFVDYAGKPIEIETLLASIERATAGRAAAAAG